MRAAHELKVLSPLRECGLTKKEIRRRSREEGLFTWDKPSYACLATRIPTGTVLQREMLETIEKAEEELKGIGFRDFRVRLFHGAARIQIPEEQMAEMIEKRDKVTELLSPYFSGLFLDLKPRRSE